eukprot:TRINITY_DN5545_c0_g1_i2.p2 TRINITY_DN5545_c0_g1~~TRINITY_DN5545_c0_g1_i2.p2  ORF type:complete len:233 (-),score=21.53 TRINITY_DN5545_c0_g1_i2:98-769(-)
MKYFILVLAIAAVCAEEMLSSDVGKRDNKLKFQAEVLLDQLYLIKHESQAGWVWWNNPIVDLIKIYSKIEDPQKPKFDYRKNLICTSLHHLIAKSTLELLSKAWYLVGCKGIEKLIAMLKEMETVPESYEVVLNDDLKRLAHEIATKNVAEIYKEPQSKKLLKCPLEGMLKWTWANLDNLKLRGSFADEIVRGKKAWKSAMDFLIGKNETFPNLNEFWNQCMT